MPRKRKEVLRKAVPTKNGRLTIVVFVRERKAKNGNDYYTEAYDINAERVTGVSTQEFRAASSCYSEEEVIARVIARTIEKFESKEIIPHEKIDYAAAFATIPEEAYDALCLPSWGRSVRRSALTFFVKNSIAIIQTILDASVITEDTLRKAQEEMINIVKGHQHNREKLMQTKDTEDVSEQGVAAAETRLDASAKKTADRRVFELNIIYQSSRLLLPEYDLPPIQIPRILLDKVVPVEQCKALPRDFLVGLAAIFTEEAEHSPFAAGGSLMLCSMLRPSEACAPKFGDILDFGTFGVYAVRKKVDSVTVEVVDALKSDAAHRTIIIPYFAMSILHRRKAYLAQKGLTEGEVCPLTEVAAGLALGCLGSYPYGLVFKKLELSLAVKFLHCKPYADLAVLSLIIRNENAAVLPGADTSALSSEGLSERSLECLSVIIRNKVLVRSICACCLPC